MSISKNGTPILAINDWEQHAGPKSQDQWVDDRSAKELARAWLAVTAPVLPPEVARTLLSHSDFGPILSWTAEPEARQPFDDFRGEPRNADLQVVLADERGPFLLSVEGKADEPFGDTVAATASAALERLVGNAKSKGLERVALLVRSLFSRRGRNEEQVGALRYQLLTAAAGAIAEARRRGFARTVVLVHEFVTSATKDELHRQNEIDFRWFTQRIASDPSINVATEKLYGPITIPGLPLFEDVPDLYLGKARRELRKP